MPFSNNVLVNVPSNFERLFGFKQFIIEPTRLCNNIESTIDLIQVTDHEKVSQALQLLVLVII